MRTAAHHQNDPGWESASDNFATDYSYDWNGNLLSLQRKNQFGQEMHNIRYTYPNGNNRLGSIAATGIASSAYQYDALGNLVRDNAEGLTVGWNALGKVDTIRRNGSLLSAFRYSPTGQRQVKASSSDTIFYIHDATGNVMCIYQLKGDTLTASERYIYGSKRLGMLGQQVWITANGVSGMHDNSTIGIRTYELTDHLGNVTFTFLDRKTLVQNPGCPLVYVPFTVSYTDYYPFGYPIPERSFYIGGYRYFFNGQEGDGEVYGQGSLAGYEFRQYDTRLGRWWGVDFRSEFLPGISPYSFSYNSPMLFVDSKGKAGVITVTQNPNGGGKIVIESIIFVYGEGAKAAAIEANNTWGEGVKQGFNSYTYYDENNKPWIVTVNVTFVVTESLNNNKTVDDNLKDISELNCQVTGIDPQTGKEYSYNSPGYGGSMIAALVHNTQELQQYSGQVENAMGWGDHGGGLIAIGAKQFIHEMFHGFGLRQHLTGKENEQDVLFTYGGGVHIRAIHFIDFCENILKLYKNGRFENGIPSTYNSDFNETPSDMIEMKEKEQTERKALYEQASKQ